MLYALGRHINRFLSQCFKGLVGHARHQVDYHSLIIGQNWYKIMYIPEWQTVYALTRGLSWCVQHNASINDVKYDDLHISPPCLAWFALCRWRHNRLLMTSTWRDNWDALDIDFVHGDIHGRACKKWCYYWLAYEKLCRVMTSFLPIILILVWKLNLCWHISYHVLETRPF